MSLVVVILFLAVVPVVVAAVVAAVLLARHRGAANEVPRQRPTFEPMTGLESALNQVTDRDGRSLKEHLDAEASHIDEFRIPDDTGPLLRRALDHVTPSDADAAEPRPQPPA